MIKNFVGSRFDQSGRADGRWLKNGSIIARVKFEKIK
jgi:hypothetical protein